MGNPRGVKRDFVALERRRFQAVKLFAKSLNNGEIGRRLKVSNQTVSRWRKEYQQGGNVALRSAGRLRGRLSSRTRLAHPAAVAVECTAAGRARVGTERGADRGLAAATLAGD